jgi:hypothetical protein
MVIVDEKGNITADFNDFAGESCIQEEKRLRDKLLKYGVSINERKATPKCVNQEMEVRIKNRSPSWKKVQI